MDFLTSSLKAGLLIGGAIIALASLCISVWFAGCYVGRPLGALVIQSTGLPASAEGHPRSEAEAVKLEETLTRMLGGMIAFSMCTVGFVVEAAFQEQRNRRVKEMRSA